MAKKKIFKFYTHSFHSLDFEIKREKRTLRQFFGSVLFGVCFRVGNAVYKSAKKTFALTKSELIQTGLNFKNRWRLLIDPSLAKGLATFLLIAFCCYGGLLTVHLFAQGLESKSKIIDLGENGGKYLLDAKNQLQNNNLSQAENKFQLAYQSFQNAQNQLLTENELINEVLGFLPQKKDADNLLEAASLLSQAGKNLTENYQQISQFKLTSSGIIAGSDGLPNLQNLALNLKKTLDGVNLAGKLLLSVNPDSLPGSYREKLVLVQNNFTVLQQSVGGLEDILTLTADLVGGDKRLLIFFENNNELRPGGGFMGTYGSLKIHEGSFKELKISSIYDLDGQLDNKILPPFPILQVNNQWFLRDSNWFADFAQSAEKNSDFFEKEDGETPDAIIVLTPSLIQNLLKLTGPINLPKYNVTFSPDNFVELAQLESSVNYDKTQNKPKQILADFVPALLEKVGSLPKDQWPQLLQLVQDSLNQKQFVIYSRDAQTENLIDSFNWGGKIKDTDRDYLNIISANLSGSKTDLYIKQSVALKTTIAEDGSITDELAITKTNQMPDLPAAANSSFIRVMVPQGSQLLSNAGFTPIDSPKFDTKGYFTDPDVAAWEKTIVKDLVSQTSIGQEAGKTFFGNWLTVKGGESKTVTLIYKLPFKINSLDHFSLLVQKQIGALPADFSYELIFSGRKLLWKNFDPNSLETSKLLVKQQMDKDYLFGEVLQNY